jgi:hypothetical protein
MDRRKYDSRRGADESSIWQRSNPSAPEAQLNLMYELVAGSERRADCPTGAGRRGRKGMGAPHKRFWPVICIALVFGLLTLGIFAAHDANQGNRPSDAALTTDFFAHEAAFDALVRMLVADHPATAAKGAAAIDLQTLARPDMSAARFATYRRLLQQISVANLRYFPDSGKLILLPDGEEDLERPSESYVYLPHAQPQSFVQHHGYYLHGPGMDILTGDRQLKGPWFIRHEVTIEVAVTPY